MAEDTSELHVVLGLMFLKRRGTPALRSGGRIVENWDIWKGCIIEVVCMEGDEDFEIIKNYVIHFD